ncbi:MAG TPA: hypothetical protein VKW08_26185 [Xanthobacteraceae bacterium]|nr:hypothetical protein [Xanthobacteraceae bacterium]
MAFVGMAIRSEQAAPLIRSPVPSPPSKSLAQCAFCREPLRFTATGINAWLVGGRFFCNEFCADGAPE